MQIPIKRKKWKWIGHVLRRQHDSVSTQAFVWNMQAKRKRVKPKICDRQGRNGKEWNLKLRIMMSGGELYISYALQGSEANNTQIISSPEDEDKFY